RADRQLSHELAAVRHHPRDRLTLPGFPAHGPHHRDVRAEAGPVERRLRVGRLPRAQPGRVPDPDLAPHAGVADPHRTQAHRLFEQVGLGEGGRPAAHAYHYPIFPCSAPESERTWSPPLICDTACPSTGASTAIPSRTPPVEPGRFTIRVRPTTPATPRDRIADGTPAAAPAERSASAIPGISRSSTR